MRDYKYSLDIMKEEIKSKFICSEIKYAFQTSIEALEKQISKEVDTNTVNKGIGVSRDYEYCPNCGQKLKYTTPQE